MTDTNPKTQQILNEWKTRQKEYDHQKELLREVLNKHGLASKEFNAARVDFEMLKEEFDNFEKENHAIISAHTR